MALFSFIVSFSFIVYCSLAATLRCYVNKIVVVLQDDYYWGILSKKVYRNTAASFGRVPVNNVDLMFLLVKEQG
jgi:hypothetical protein